MYTKIKKYYDEGRWSKLWVKNAVKKGQITSEQYKDITGETYE
jgi:uncharacterized XkdX family phage protein